MRGSNALNDLANKMANFPWEYAATNGITMQPRGRSSAVVLIGFGGIIPPTIATTITPEMFVLHIDKLVPNLYDAEYYVYSEWQDFLRLETTGPNSQDHPYLKSLRKMTVAWYGNAAIFDSTVSLMIAASYYTDGDTFSLYGRIPKKYGREGSSRMTPGELREYVGNPVVASALRMGHDNPELFDFVLVAETPRIHPMSGKLPIDVHAIDRFATLSVMLEVLWYVGEFEHSGHYVQCPKIYRNLYSVFSANTKSMILMISYWGIYMNGDGTVQDKVNSYAQYRMTIASRYRDLANRWMELTETKTLETCADALLKHFAVEV